MDYRELAPPPALRQVLECGWRAELPPGSAEVESAVLPDGAMDLMWFGGALLVAGPDTRPHAARRVPGEPGYGLRFRPGALPGLLGVPASALRDARVPLADLASRPARAATARLESGEAPLRVLTELAAGLLPGPSDRPLDPTLDVVVGQVRAGRSAAAIADALGWTTRTLHRQSLAAFGYGPATLRRVLRFRRAVDLLHAGVAPAAAAARAGYADQPHLSREVRALSGRAPAQLASGANRSTPVPSGSRSVA